jgi:hypothetical protein
MTYLASAYLLFVLHLLHCFCFESLILFLLLFLLFLLEGGGGGGSLSVNS